MKRSDHSNVEARSRASTNAVAIATAILDGTLGLIEGVRELSTLGHVVVDDWRVDPDFVVFGAVASETDDLPVGKDRERWDSAALVQQDAEVTRVERLFQPKVHAACRNVIRRFTDV